MPDNRRESLASDFRLRFGRGPEWVAEAPGRVNLIGEHTDYNEGFVLPSAIDRTVLVAGAPSAGPRSRIWSAHLGEESAFDASSPERSSLQPWSNYVRGVAWALGNAGLRIGQVDLLLESSVPPGAGLSSSAALEVACGAALAAAAGVRLAPRDLALLAHRAETEFVGVPCGIMDQFASCLAVEDHALLIDCRSHSTQAVPLGLWELGLVLAVVDSAVSRQLAGSAYRTRRQECQEVVRLLQPRLPHRPATLRELVPDDLKALADRMPPTLLRRARHVVTENRRVLDFVSALRRHSPEEMGRLLMESHRSLRDDYQVSCAELDLLAELAWRTPGVVGARLTGAGFGGCTINLVEATSVGRFEQEVVEEYRRRTGQPARMHLCRAVAGVALSPP